MRISDLKAHKAFRMPISRVLSVTDTSMIFMTQIHPTMSDIAAIPARKFVRVPVTCSMLESISLMVLTENSASSMLGTPVYFTSSSSISVFSKATLFVSSISTSSEE